jgi:YcxB-like protein
MNFIYDNSPEDMMEFQKYHLLNSKLYKQSRLKNILIGPLVFSIFLLFKFIHGEVHLTTVLVFTGLSLCWILLYPGHYKKNIIKKTRKIIKESDINAFIGKKEIEVNELGINVVSETSQSKYVWDKIVKIGETEKYLFIYITSLSAISIPKDKIISSNTTQDIIDFIKSKKA